MVTPTFQNEYLRTPIVLHGHVTIQLAKPLKSPVTTNRGRASVSILPTVNRAVIDRTGLPGVYDFVLRYTPDGVSPRAGGVATPMTDGTSLITAVQEQLGLKLES